MKVLVTGGAGYIGSHTTQKLLDAGYEVVVYDNLSSGFAEAVPGAAKLIVGDILDFHNLSRVIQEESISAIIHFAAKLIVPESLKKPLEYYENNTIGVWSLAKACSVTGVKKVIFSSTAAVYGDAGRCDLISEDTPVKPLNPYGYSKLMSEQILHDMDKVSGLKSVCLRYFNVAGAAANGENGQRTKDATHLIKVACEAACGIRSSVAIFGSDYSTPDGTGVRDYIHVEDLADVHVLALRYLENGGSTQILNCGYGHGFSVREVIDAIKKVSGSSFVVKNEPRRLGDAGHIVADPSKIKQLFGWIPKKDNLELICLSAYNWEKRRRLDFPK